MRSSFKTSTIMLVSVFVIAGACSRQNIVDNTFDAGVFVGKTAVKGAVGAGKLAVRGTKAAIQAARESNAAKSDFPSGTAVCENASGGYYAALINDDGDLYCLPKSA